jgi:hypothetical protein
MTEEPMAHNETAAAPVGGLAPTQGAAQPMEAAERDTVIQDILRQASMANDTLRILSNSLTQSMSEIDARVRAAHRTMTIAETTKFDALGNQLLAVNGLVKDLAWDTLKRLSASDAVKSLAASIDGLDEGMKKTMEGLQRLQRNADTAAQAFDLLDKALKGLVALKIPPFD